MLGATSLVPALPVPAGTVAVPASYNRYMYGLAVFHARTRMSLNAADLTARLRVSSAIADALMGEMQRKGVIAPALNAAAGTMRAVSLNGRLAARPGSLAEAARQYAMRGACTEPGSASSGRPDAELPEPTDFAACELTETSLNSSSITTSDED
ncbi:MAG: hypothetical protein AAF718_00970 [Pseudomonadota bacterium]